MIKHIPFEKIDPNPWQTRLMEDPEHITALMDSIKQDGLLQIPTGRPVDGPDGRVQLAFGHSRAEACRRLSLQGLFPSKFPLNVTDLTDEEMFRWAVTENNSRKDLTPIEVARSMRTYRDDFGKSSREIGQLFGLSDSAVRNKIRLLALPTETQDQVERGALTETAARSLLQLQRFSPEKVAEVTTKAVDERLSSEEVVHLSTQEIYNMEYAKSMHASYDEDPPLAGTDLWQLRKWIPDIDVDDKAFISQIYDRLMEAVREENIQVDDPETAPVDWDAFTADIFEGMVANYFNYPDKWTELYAGYGFRFHEIFRALVDQQHTCSACPFYLVGAGTHYCGNTHCWDWRKDQYLFEEGLRLSDQLGVSLYQHTDGKLARFADYNGWQTSHAGQKKVIALFERWLTDRDPRLRLKKYGRNYRSFELTGHKFYDLVCVGDAIDEVEAAYQEGLAEDVAREKEQASKPSEWQIEQAKREATDAFLETIGYLVFSTIFEKLPHELLVWYYTEEWEKPGEDQVLMTFTERFIDHGLDFEEKLKGPMVVATHLKNLAAAIGLELPTDWMERAAALEPVFEASDD